MPKRKLQIGRLFGPTDRRLWGLAVEPSEPGPLPSDATPRSAGREQLIPPEYFLHISVRTARTPLCPHQPSPTRPAPRPPLATARSR